MLGVDEECLEQYGAVSRECACAMAQGALEKSGADFVFSITGFAGPGGEAGTVWIATVGQGGSPDAELFHFRGSRNQVRRKAAEKALEKLLKLVIDYYELKSEKMNGNFEKRQKTQTRCS